jgi:hypothetical protein
MTTLTPEQYWKLRAIVADAQRVEIDAQIAVAKAQARKAEHMTACGLDPQAAYRLNDDTLSVEAVEEGGRG